MGSGLGLPETVEIAVFIGGDNGLALCQCKNRLGLLTGLQVLLLIALAGLENDEGDVVGVQHGMRNGADLNPDAAAVCLDHGDMLFTGGVGGVGNELDQLFRLEILGAIGDYDFSAVGKDYLPFV